MWWLYTFFIKIGLITAMALVGGYVTMFLDEGVIQDSTAFLTCIMAAFALNLLVTEDRHLLLPFVTREPKSVILRRETVLGLLSTSNLYAGAALVIPFLYSVLETDLTSSWGWFLPSALFLGLILKHTASYLGMWFSGSRRAKAITLTASAAVIGILFLLRKHPIPIDFFPLLAKPLTAVVLFPLAIASTAASKKVIENDLRHIYDSGTKARTVTLKEWKGNRAVVPAATALYLRCPAARSMVLSMFTIALMFLCYSMMLKEKLSLFWLSAALGTCELYLLPNIMSNYSMMLDGLFTRPLAFNRVIDTVFGVNIGVTIFFTAICLTFNHFLLKGPMLPILALFFLAIGPVSEIAIIQYIYPLKLDLWGKRQKNNFRLANFLLGMARCGVLWGPAALLPLNPTYFSWFFIIISLICLPFYGMIRDFVCKEIHERRYKLFEQMR